MALIFILLPLNLFASSFSVATYNVENLFDNEVGRRKVLQINKVIQSMGEPEFIGLQEVENEKILSPLKNYKKVMAKNSDKRGMRVAFLFKKGEIIRVGEIPIKNSRSILEVEIKLDDLKVTFFIIHWPSQRNPPALRKETGNILLKRIKKIPFFVILGDFNLDDRFEFNPFFYYKKIIDLNNGEGTYFYIPFRQWRVFDKVIISKSLFKRLSLFEYRVFKPDFISTKLYLNDKIIDIPRKFNKKSEGYSDHFPVILKMDFKTYRQNKN